MLALLAPRAWGVHLLALLALAAAVALGVWQHDVWAAERTAATTDVTRDAPVPLASVLTGDGVLLGDDVGRPVTLSGTWMPESTYFVAGREHDGRRGYWVMTPVRIGSSAMAVVRGWSPATKAAAVSGPVTLTGWLQGSEDSGPPDDDPVDRVLPSLRIASLAQHVSTDLYGAFVVDRSATPGLAAVAAPSMPRVSWGTGLRNLLYSFQWWFFGLFVVVVWWRWCADQLRGRAGLPG